MKIMSSVVMERWQRRITQLYSTTPKINHITVIPIKSAADTLVFLHSNTSATACKFNYSPYKVIQIKANSFLAAHHN